MGKNDHKIIHKDEKTVFPWGWFIFLIICLPAGFEGFIVWFLILVFVKIFTKTVR